MPYPEIPLQLAYGTTIGYECDVRGLEQQQDPGLLRSRVTPGLNAVRATVTVNQLIENGNEMEAFLQGRRGIMPFSFPSDAPPEILGKLWRCKEYTINQASAATVKGCSNGMLWQFSATLQQVFRGAS